jgi:Zn-dependent protease
VILNLIPIPPLDGFGIVSPYLDPATRARITRPPTGTILFVGLFVVVWAVPQFSQALFALMQRICEGIGFDYYSMAQSFVSAL